MNRLIRITISGDVRLGEISKLTTQSNELAKKNGYGILLDFRDTAILISAISAQFYPVAYISSLDKDYAGIPVALVTTPGNDTDLWQRFMDSAKKEQLAIEMFHDCQSAESSLLERLQCYAPSPFKTNALKPQDALCS